MKSIQKLIYLIISLSVVGCVSSPKEDGSNIIVDYYNIENDPHGYFLRLVGVWYSREIMEDGRLHESTDTLRRDGSFETEFVVTRRDGTQQKAVAYGFWAVTQQFHFTIERGIILDDLKIPLRNGPNSGALYKIVSLTDSEFIYESLRSGNRFRAIKLSDHNKSR